MNTRFLVTAMVALVPVAGCAATAEVQDPPTAETTSAISRGLDGCPGAYPSCGLCGSHSCGQPCCAHESEPGFEIDYRDDCSAWTRPEWVVKASQPPLLCHIDPDRHWNEVEIELYAATAYEDTSCAPQPDRWRKQRVSTVECSLWTSITDKEKCARRVRERVLSLAAQGYLPIVQEENQDLCPYPRF